MPKETKTSYETLTVKKQDITVPMKFSAKMKGQTDATHLRPRTVEGQPKD
jgi:membrane fusion protein (multidrug efflux system)